MEAWAQKGKEIVELGCCGASSDPNKTGNPKYWTPFRKLIHKSELEQMGYEVFYSDQMKQHYSL